MFFLHRPTPARLDQLLADAGQMTLSYARPGLARETAPAGFRVETERGVLGHGPQVFARAAHAFAEWRQFDLGWVDSYPPAAPLVPGTNVLVIARHLGFYSVNACRVVYTLGEGDFGVGGRGPGSEVAGWEVGVGGRLQVAGFAYGTLNEHAEAGEEIFELSINPTSGEVAYRIRAVSRERALFARLGFPVARALQARFRRDSIAAMQRAVAESAPRAPRG